MAPPFLLTCGGAMQEKFNFEGGSEKSLNSGIYSEQAIWLCKNRQTGFHTKINGALAQVLKKYPKDYRLKFLKIKETADEYGIAVGE
jgi:hypothetical protein